MILVPSMMILMMIKVIISMITASHARHPTHARNHTHMAYMHTYAHAHLRTCTLTSMLTSMIIVASCMLIMIAFGFTRTDIRSVYQHCFQSRKDSTDPKIEMYCIILFCCMLSRLLPYFRECFIGTLPYEVKRADSSKSY